MSTTGSAALKTAATPMQAPAAPLGVDRHKLNLSVFAAIAAVAILGFNPPLLWGISAGAVVVIVLVPVWGPALSNYRYMRPLMAFGAVALTSGALLFVLGDHAFNMRWGLATASLLIAGVGGVGVLLWARTFLPTWQVALVFGLGYLLNTASAIPGSANPWKYQLSVPITIIALALASRAKSAVPTVTVLLLIGFVSALFDSRSYFGFCLVAVVLFLWQRRPQIDGKKLGKGALLAMICMLIVAGYTIGTSLLTGGYLGHDAQERTIAQIEQSGSLIAGGRPEMFGTFALMSDSPLGFGPGAVPSSADVLVAKTGMHADGVPTDNGYINHFMFGGHFELHSVIADFWASFGIGGLLLGIAIFVIIGLSLLGRLTDRTASGLVAMMGIVALWDLLFGPIYSNLPDIMLAIAITIPFVAGAVTIGGEVRDD